ncbi:hypothetical protein DSO57_1024528 [Entomophthora muscae]|uniref:Uncharacterized protein n=1 Tax=Entomophthora muscae TaxID=34485 RepID=A0ACC2TDN8_9FUNG|nr:hypothetical protein DSO57_1024528 [Entomophthora muscae]
MPSSIYKYYPTKEGRLTCVVCSYTYNLEAPLSTLQKHLRVKHNFSVRNPPSYPPASLIPEKAKELSVRFHPLMQEQLVPSRPVVKEAPANEPHGLTPAEESLVKWAFQEKIPSAALESMHFQRIFLDSTPPRIQPILKMLTKMRDNSSLEVTHPRIILPPISLLFAHCKDDINCSRSPL